VILLAVNGFRIEFAPFTLLIASLAALNSIAFAFCSFKALDSIDLSLFSLFSMLGGMLLPFFQGILFFYEPITVSKIPPHDVSTKSAATSKAKNLFIKAHSPPVRY
jgi:hypothetical protein